GGTIWSGKGLGLGLGLGLGVWGPAVVGGLGLAAAVGVYSYYRKHWGSGL
ncbi:MAG: hypothetical protein HQL33_01225, partial [Alphaproteobacteria bacterium]|nr:hypothetical protein [Alphaproteobacteria bacterium]